MCRWLQAHFVLQEQSPPGTVALPARLDPQLVEVMRRPVITVGEPPWEEEQGLGWSIGTYAGQRTLSHSGADPGFSSKLVVLPEGRIGVVVLANSNMAPAEMIASAAVDVALEAAPGDGLEEMRAILPPVVGPVAKALAASGADAAMAAYGRLVAADPAECDLDDSWFADAVWGAIELHRTGMVWPLLRVWTTVRPESSMAWTMTGWAHQIDGDLHLARRFLQRALDLDPDNDDAKLIVSNLGAN
jgi:hypothetical protein